jgi:hypothetical protein
MRSDEDADGTGADEARDQILRKPMIDLRRRIGRPLPPVAARVVDVGVEAVLVRKMTRPAVPDTELTTAPTTQISDSDAWRSRVRRRVALDDLEDESHEPCSPVPAPRSIG